MAMAASARMASWVGCWPSLNALDSFPALWVHVPGAGLDGCLNELEERLGMMGGTRNSETRLDAIDRYYLDRAAIGRDVPSCFG